MHCQPTHFICAQPNGIEILKVSLVTSSACDHKIIIRISLFTRTKHTQWFANFNFWEAAEEISAERSGTLYHKTMAPNDESAIRVTVVFTGKKRIQERGYIKQQPSYITRHGKHVIRD